MNELTETELTECLEIARINIRGFLTNNDHGFDLDLSDEHLENLLAKLNSHMGVHGSYLGVDGTWREPCGCTEAAVLDGVHNTCELSNV